VVRHPLAAAAVEEALEAALRRLLAAHRREAGLATRWDEGLAYLLGPALLAYEAERAGGPAAGAAGAAEFQQGLRRAVPAGHTFRGFPMHAAHLSAPRLAAELRRARVAAELLALGGGADGLRFALRAHVAPYPERACAVWVMLAAVYARAGPAAPPR
jgi:centrosomal protein CEP76